MLMRLNQLSLNAGESSSITRMMEEARSQEQEENRIKLMVAASLASGYFGSCFERLSSS
jgi:hypothetical protein